VNTSFLSVKMAKRRDTTDDRYLAGSSTPKRRRDHKISDTEQEDYSDDESVRFGDPTEFLRKFGGYDTLPASVMGQNPTWSTILVSAFT
jgi:hypothetical protein